MKWVEILNLRSAGVPRESIEQEIPRSVAEVDRSNNLVAIRIYRHATLDTDLGVHLLFESPGPEMRPSALGQRLAAALKGFGLVSHSVWIQQKETEQGE